MMGVLEADAVSNLLSKGFSLARYIQEGYYKGSAARDDFPVQIDLLKKKHEEWSEQLREHGMAEDPNIRSLLESAAKSLAEEEKKVQKIKNSRWNKVKIMAFPDQLTLILKLIIFKIEAGPKLVASRVENNDLLRKFAAQSRSVLPFGTDHKYVPIPSAVEKVQNALEDLSGPRVVTISGMPGLGKTGLAKHIALLYDEQLQQPLSQPCFPHGVHFLQCGKGACDRVRGLQGLLLQSLGFEAPPESSSSHIQNRGDYMLLESNNTKLRSCLVKRKVLIIFDDVWETELVQNLIVPGMGVKYLITSQIKDIWNDAFNVELENPDMDQAIKIMARNTKGLSPPYEFTDCVKEEVEEIIRRLDFHPLSMSTVAVSIDHKRITDPKTWKEVKENIHKQLQESAFYPNPLLYEMKYPLPVAASMMLMVNSLQQDPRELLFVTALCDLYDNFGVLEAIAKYFFQFLQPRRERYKSSKKYLEGRSIIESKGLDDELFEAHLTMHGLRRVFIREEKTVDLRSTATRILSKRINGTADKSSDANSWSTTAATILSNLKNWTASGNSDANNIHNALRLLLAAVYGGKSEIFREVILQTKIHDAPWISSGKEALDLVESGGQNLPYELLDLNLIRLLKVNADAGGWEREANDSASKILLRWICRRELDDEGMARLLELPRTTAQACITLRYVFWAQHSYGKAFYHAFCFDQCPTFSSLNPKTVKSLKDLAHNNAAEPTRRAAVVAALGVVANFETEEFIMLLAEEWAQMLADNSTPEIQFAAAEALLGDHRLGFIMGACEGVLEALLDNLKSIDASDRLYYRLSLDEFCQSKDTAVRIANIPGALEKILAAFVSNICDLVPVCEHISEDNAPIFSAEDHRLKALLTLSSIAENKMKFVPVLSSLLQVVETLLPVDPKHWYGSSHERIWKNYRIPYGCIGNMLNAARIVGNLGLVTEIRDIIMARPSIQRGLLNLLEGRSEIDQLNIFKFADLCHFPSRVAAKTLTMLGVSYKVSSTSSALSPLRESAGPCALIYMGRAEAKEALGLFSEALADLNTALDCESQLIRPNAKEELRSDYSIEESFTDCSSEYYPSWGIRVEILSRSAFLKGKIERYQEAVKDVDSFIEMFPERYKWSDLKEVRWSALILRGILQRKSGNLQGAFNDMMKISINDDTGLNTYTRYKFSKQLQLLKRMSEDLEGAMKEAEFTDLLVLRKVVWEPTTFGHLSVFQGFINSWVIPLGGYRSVGLWHSLAEEKRGSYMDY